MASIQTQAVSKVWPTSIRTQSLSSSQSKSVTSSQSVSGIQIQPVFEPSLLIRVFRANLCQKVIGKILFESIKVKSELKINFKNQILFREEAPVLNIGLDSRAGV